MILLPQWKTRFLQYFNLAAHFPVKFLLELPVAQGYSRAPLNLYYNPTKTAPISKSRIGLVTVLGIWRNQF